MERRRRCDELVVEKILKKEGVDMKVEWNKNARVIDKVTGYTGRVTAVCDYYGERPTSYLVESIDRTGRPVEQWVDEQRLVEA